MVLSRVVGLTRYPLKSTGGEPLTRVAVTGRGLDGDRSWAVYADDGRIGSGKNSRRFQRVDGLLRLRSRLVDGVPVVELPDGSTAVAGRPETDARLGELLGRPVTLRAEADVPHHDASPVHLVTTASLRRLEELVGAPVDARRMRANLVLDVPGSGFAEDGWAGRRIAVGDEVLLDLGEGMPRCVMVTAAQPGIEHEPAVLRALARENDLNCGLQATVARGGEIALGDEVRFA